MPTIESVGGQHICPDQKERAVPTYTDTKNLGGILPSTIRIADYYPAYIPYDQMANADTHMACSRYGIKQGAMYTWETAFGLRHAINPSFTFNYVQEDPRLVWEAYLAQVPSAETEGATLLSAIAQMATLGSITDTASVVQTVDDLVSCLDNLGFVYTWSSRGLWTNIENTGVYEQRTDGLVVNHCWCIVRQSADDPNTFFAINSLGDVWPFHGLFTITADQIFGDGSDLFTKYACYVPFVDNIIADITNT